MLTNNDDDSLKPFFMASHPTRLVDMSVDWDEVLGYGQRPGDVRKSICDENEKEGPYSWDLACKIASVVRLKDDFRCGHPLVSQELFNEWFNMNFYMIKSEKLQGVKRPVPSRPKGFWKSLFG